jgi:SpoVK/Ycf46/Vps4 family AAA+-type ATPase
LRRLPRSFRVSLPTEAGRKQILEMTLKDHPMTPDARQFLPTLAKLTEGYSGSDLKEMCRCAAMESVHEKMKDYSKRAVMGQTTTTKGGRREVPTGESCRPMSKNDLKGALIKVKRTGQDAAEYERAEFEEKRLKQPGTQTITFDMLQNMILAASQLNMNGGQPRRQSSSSAGDDDDGDDVPEIN